jgi:hypothetical protein
MTLSALGIFSAAGAGRLSDYEHIATAFGTGLSGVIDFTSISSDYKHLQIRFTAKNSISGRQIAVVLNNITSTSYPNVRSISGNGTSFVAGSTISLQNIPLSQSLADIDSATAVASAGIIEILDYASSSKNTTVRTFFGNASAITHVALVEGFLNNTATINRVTLSTSGNFTTISRFSLYGIRG